MSRFLNQYKPLPEEELVKIKVRVERGCFFIENILPQPIL